MNGLDMGYTYLNTKLMQLHGEKELAIVSQIHR